MFEAAQPSTKPLRLLAEQALSRALHLGIRAWRLRGQRRREGEQDR